MATAKKKQASKRNRPLPVVAQARFGRLQHIAANLIVELKNAGATHVEQYVTVGEPYHFGALEFTARRSGRKGQYQLVVYVNEPIGDGEVRLDELPRGGIHTMGRSTFTAKATPASVATKGQRLLIEHKLAGGVKKPEPKKKPASKGRKNPPRKIDRKAYKFYTVDASGLIEGGWEYREDANERKADAKLDGIILKVYTRSFLVKQGKDPVNDSSWLKGPNWTRANPAPKAVRAKGKNEIVAWGKVVKVFKEERKRMSKKFPDLAMVGLAPDYSMHDSPRHYAKTGKEKDVVWTRAHPGLGLLSVSAIRGVIIHELNHAARLLGLQASGVK